MELCFGSPPLLPVLEGLVLHNLEILKYLGHSRERVLSGNSSIMLHPLLEPEGPGGI